MDRPRDKDKPKSRASAGLHLTGYFSGFNTVLDRFGIKKAERASPEERAQKAKEQDSKQTVENVELKRWIGARLPALAFILILGSFTYLYHVSPIVPWLFVFFSLDFALIVTWPPKMIAGRRREASDWNSFWSWMIHVSLAVSIGLANYAIIENWVNTTFLREYNDVSPTSDPVIVQDGGILNFKSGTKLDVDSAAGYKFWLHRYCAAPIVGPDDPAAAPIGYWAVGIGCCKSRGDFTCDSGEDANAISAMPLRPHNMPPELVERYDHAIQMSAAASGFEVSKNRILVTWQLDPHGVGKTAWWTSSITFLVLATVTLIVYQCMADRIYLSTFH